MKPAPALLRSRMFNGAFLIVFHRNARPICAATSVKRTSARCRGAALALARSGCVVRQPNRKVHTRRAVSQRSQRKATFIGSEPRLTGGVFIVHADLWRCTS